MINKDTPALVVPNDVTAKEWRSITSLPWSKQAKASKDGTFTFIVSFVPRETFKSFVKFVTRPKAKRKMPNAAKPKRS